MQRHVYPVNPISNTDAIKVTCVVTRWILTNENKPNKQTDVASESLSHLIFFVPTQADRRVVDLYEDLRDGHNLISLLEVLSGETLVSIAAIFTRSQSHCVL